MAKIRLQQQHIIANRTLPKLILKCVIKQTDASRKECEHGFKLNCG